MEITKNLCIPRFVNVLEKWGGTEVWDMGWMEEKGVGKEMGLRVGGWDVPSFGFAGLFLGPGALPFFELLTPTFPTSDIHLTNVERNL